MNADQKSANWGDYALLIVLSAIFGASFLLIKIGVAEVPTLSMVAARLLIAAVILWVVMILAKQSLPRGQTVWMWIFLAAIFGNVLPWGLITWGEKEVPAGLTAILMATMPLATLLLAHIFTTDEKMNVWKVAGVVCGIGGVIVLIGWKNLSALGDEVLHQYAIAAAAICYGINAIITKQLVNQPWRAVSAALMILSFAIVAPAALLIDQPWTLTPSADVLYAILLLGIFPSALGTIMLFALVARQGASFLSLINFLVPVFGILWSVIFLSEVLPNRAFIALAIILFGVAIARIKPKSSLHSQTAGVASNERS